LTCDFLAKFGKRKITIRVKAIGSVVSALVVMISHGVDVLVLRDGGWLRDSGFFAALRMTAEAKKAEADPLWE
jgi:hypothetical protein